jgi:Fic family protein
VFANRTDLPALVQAAIAHAQFETIHPFADGNGRTGRALIYAVLRRRGLVTHAIPPISLILATNADQYIGSLQRYRHDGDPAAPAYVHDVNDWIATFAAAASAAVAQAQLFEGRIATITEQWRLALGVRRADAASRRLIDRLAARPVLTIAAAAEVLDVSDVSAAKAIDELVAAGVLVKRSTGRRNQVFEARDIIDALTDLLARLTE